MENKFRLQKRIAELGYCSRRKAEELISKGKVKVNGEVILTQGMMVSQGDEIEVEGYSKKENSKLVAFLFNKPLGVVCSSNDDRGRTIVLDYFKNEPYRLYNAGRLDYNTSGALIITNDGELANLITHPSSHLEKTYIAKLNRIFNSKDGHILEKGIMLDDGLTSPAKVEILSNEVHKVLIKITIHEGRNRQVRRMFEALNYQVLTLHRISIGFLSVKDIKRGSYRELTALEINTLKTIAKKRRDENIIPSYKKKS